MSLSSGDGPADVWELRCLRCDGRALNARPSFFYSLENGAHVHAADARRGSPAEFERQAQREFPRLRQLLADVGLREGAMLEIGCSYGSMLRRFRDLGWDAVGIEWDARAAEAARDPLRFVSSLAKTMRPGSLRLLRTPNSRSLAARICSGWWQWTVAPEHVHLFSPASLMRLPTSEGFKVSRRDFRRGDANSTLFELIHSAGKVVLVIARRS